MDRPEVEHAAHLYVLRLNPERLSISRKQSIEEVKARNIGTSGHFMPIHLHPYYWINMATSPRFPTGL